MQAAAPNFIYEKTTAKVSPVLRHGQIIFTADDFGASSEINRAIIQAHRHGMLTAASLMVTGAAFDEAVELAKQTPTLAVGLHLVASDAASALPAGKIPHLVDQQGRLPRDPAKVGMRLAFSHRARVELAAEFRAQFEKFSATGLRLVHVDGHMHLHVHPAAIRPAVELAVEFQAGGMRLPREPVAPVVGDMRESGLSGIGRTAVLGILARRAKKLLETTSLKYAAFCYGISRTGDMSSRYVIQSLARLGSLASELKSIRGSMTGSTQKISAEFVFHPTQSARTERLGANPGDLETLMDPTVRSTLEKQRMELANYYTLLGN